MLRATPLTGNQPKTHRKKEAVVPDAEVVAEEAASKRDVGEAVAAEVAVEVESKSKEAAEAVAVAVVVVADLSESKLNEYQQEFKE